MLCIVTASLLVTAAAAGQNDFAQCHTGSCGTSLLQVHATPQKSHHDGKKRLNQTETDFVAKVLTSYGKQSSSYEGAQVLTGFRSGAKSLLDDDGMFAFDDSIKSVAIDVGAASNPMIFDMDKDMSQLVLAFEPIFDLNTPFEDVAREVAGRGGCTDRWESFCVNQRLVVFPAAMSSEIGLAEFHVAANPYCSSLNSVPGGLDPGLTNHSDPEVRNVMAACWGSLNESPTVKTVPTVTLASILRRIPEHIRVKYIKIDAQGQDYKVLLSAAEQMHRIEYVRFEMQVDPPPGRKMVADIPSYAEMEKSLKSFGFVHESPTACNFDAGSSPFSKAIEEKECVFCRKLPCREGGVPPLGVSPWNVLSKRKEGKNKVKKVKESIQVTERKR